MRKFGFIMAAPVFVVLSLTRPVAATLVVGVNNVLGNNESTFYIPLKTETSGVLGDPLGGDDYVGLQPDIVDLEGYQPASSGYLDFTLNFTLETGEEISLDVTVLTMTFEDIDFKPTIHTKWDFRESLELSYAAKEPLIIDNTNYGTHTSGFVETNNKTVVYTVNLTELGLTNEDIVDINADGQFDLQIRFEAFVTHQSSCGIRLSNTPETANFTINTVPEPTTIALLAEAMLMTLVLKRRVA